MEKELDKYDEMLDYYFKVINTTGIDNTSKLNTLIKISIILLENKKDFNNALKYASIASIMTYSPRADVCCLIGDIYLEMENIKWAIKWYENAIGNLPQIDELNGFDNKYASVIPMMKLCNAHYEDGEYEEANELNNAVLMIEPENEDALYNKEKLYEKLNKS